MAGVIDKNGVQWERCCVCGNFTKLTSLGYSPPTKKYPYGLDICLSCANKLPQAQLRKVVPAASWQAS